MSSICKPKQGRNEWRACPLTLRSALFPLLALSSASHAASRAARIADFKFALAVSGRWSDACRASRPS
jgi:hypothetical protein